LPAAGEDALRPALTAVDCAGPAMSDMPSGQSEKNWRPPAVIEKEVSMIGLPSLSNRPPATTMPLEEGTTSPVVNHAWWRSVWRTEVPSV
jgi:hypothetical protein